jgi:hypothetical protein
VAFNWHKHNLGQVSPETSEEGSKMKVNKSYLKNYPFAGRFLILLGSLVFSLQHATEGTAVACEPLGLSPFSSAAASEQSGPPDILPDILIDAFLGDAQIVLERRTRKAGTNTLKYLVIKLETGRVSRISLRAIVEGADAHQGSLPYALAWLAGNTDPLGSVRALGYDIEVVKEHERPCADQLPSKECVNLGRQLATLIDATLGFGSLEERAQFRRDASAIGIAPDCSPQEP